MTVYGVLHVVIVNDKIQYQKCQFGNDVFTSKEECMKCILESCNREAHIITASNIVFKREKFRDCETISYQTKDGTMVIDRFDVVPYILHDKED